MTSFPTEKDNYVLNAILMSIDRGIPFDFDHIVQKAVTAYGNSGSNPFSKRFNQIWKEHYHFLPERDYLLRRGYIKKLQEPKNHFILDTKGEKAQEVGGLTDARRQEKWDMFLDRAIKLATGVLSPSIAVLALLIALYPTCKKQEPVEIKQPITIHLKTLDEIKVNDSTKQSEKEQPPAKDRTPK